MDRGQLIALVSAHKRTLFWTPTESLASLFDLVEIATAVYLSCFG
jgi:hypothetical protein